MFSKKYTPKGKIIIGIYLISLLTIVIISSSYVLSYVSDQLVQVKPVVSEATGDVESSNVPIDNPNEDSSLPNESSNKDLVANPVDEKSEIEPEVIKESTMSNENGTYSTDDLKILKEAHTTVYFDFQSFKVLDSAKASVESFIDIVNAYPEETIVIEGHADGYPNFSNTAMEVELASNRIKAIHSILSGRNVDSSKIEIINGGSSHPVSVEKSERQKNDYVEIYFKDYIIKNINGK